MGNGATIWARLHFRRRDALGGAMRNLGRGSRIIYNEMEPGPMSPAVPRTRHSGKSWSKPLPALLR
jgi:hypothetical protein